MMSVARVHRCVQRRGIGKRLTPRHKGCCRSPRW
jgi:hypothetical protein